MNPLHTLFNNLGIKRTEPLRESIPDESLQKIVCDIARQEKKTENQILHEIVRIALERRTNNTIQRIQWDRLTPREKESIAYTCLGYTNQQT